VNERSLLIKQNSEGMSTLHRNARDARDDQMDPDLHGGSPTRRSIMALLKVNDRRVHARRMATAES